jgi:Na+/H+ antiporter NhaD/arsenite permease-like protein
MVLGLICSISFLRSSEPPILDLVIAAVLLALTLLAAETTSIFTALKKLDWKIWLFFAASGAMIGGLRKFSIDEAVLILPIALPMSLLAAILTQSLRKMKFHR